LGGFMDDIIASTMNYWEKKQVNCARSAACGLLDFYQVKDSQILYKTFTTFGGGIGEGTICGGLIGALGALNLILAERGLNDKEISDKAKDLKTLFRREFDTLECRTLMDEFRTKDGTIDFSNPERRKKCTHAVITAIKCVQPIVDGESSM
ncbi:MAG: C-GCAxxG-C-C family (seleno)protein, partial [Promethearchaeota archaeon]